MNRWRAVALLLWSVSRVFASCYTMPNPIDSGYGARGPFTVCRDSIPAPTVKGASVHLFRPCRTDTVWPVVFFFHGIGASDPSNYRELCEHLASRGLAVLYPPFSKMIAMAKPEMAYAQLRAGFDAGVEKWWDKLDSTRVGFMGHSYGGGAVPALSLEWIRQRLWGKNGAFLYIMAPWYSYEISPLQLDEYPQSVTMIMEVFEHDYINDHRMAKDIFDHIPIADSAKNYIILQSDSSHTPPLYAGHATPSGAAGGESTDYLDYYGIWRLADALVDYTFNGNSAARKLAFGSGNARQRYMGTWSDGALVKELRGGHNAFVYLPQNNFMNFWSHARNPRYRVVTFFGEEPEWGHRERMTIRNYINVRPGAGEMFDTMDVVHADSGQPVCPITSGFGSSGPYKVQKRDFFHPVKGHGKIYLFSPVGIDRPAPVILFLHGFQWPMPDYYQGFINNIVSQGYHVIFPSYMLYSMTVGNKKRYELMLAGAVEAFTVLGNTADTTRIGFIGHSYGGGAVPAVAWHFLKLKRWGRNGAFMFILAPWYVFNFEPEQFSNFPSETRMLIEVFEGDRFNDWRMAEDLFYSFTTIPYKNKDFVIVHNDEYNDEELEAEHTSPLSSGGDDINVIDYYALYRLADALAAETFYGDTLGRAVALGGGSSRQIFMGTWPDGTPVAHLTVTDKPVTPYPQFLYLFNWGLLWNKRRHEYKPLGKFDPLWFLRKNRE
ncbi:MAG: hypothetical protein JW863_14820 [Chitinispirillaceae bacterium]|nr:hypothetical protein [Chitinispirillaceae bacterium]